MRYKFPIIVFSAILIFISCNTKVEIKKTPPQKKSCSFSQFLHYQKVCLDGIWILSEAPFGLNKEFRFKRRGYKELRLVPVLSDTEKKQLEKKIKSGDLDTATVTAVLSIQGVFQDNFLIIEQRNPTDKFPNIYRYKLHYKDGIFTGSMYTISKVYKTRRGVRISLKRKGNQQLKQKEKQINENLDF